MPGDPGEIYAGDMYVDALGPPDRNAEFRRADEIFEVFRWHLGKQLILYAAFDGRPARSAVSLAVLADRPQDSIAPELAWAQRRVQDREAELVRAGDTVTLASPLWPSSAMNALLLIQPSAPLAFVVPVDALHRAGVHVFQAVPIHPAEIELKNSVGVAAFVDMVFTGGRHLDLDRPSIA